MKQHDKISTRLALILTKLNNAERFTPQELCEEFNVNIRTIQRDLNDRLSYLPIKKENGYYSLETYALGKLSFEDIKSFATLSGIKNLYPDLNENFIVDILNSKINPTYRINTIGYENLKEKVKEFELLSSAILNKQKISFIYKGKNREINPYKLINNNGIWYLVGDENNILKTYSFSKIKNLQLQQDIFYPTNEFLNIIEKNEFTWYSDNIIEVTLEITGEKIEYFLRRDILPNQKIIQHTDDKLILSTKTTYDEEILGIVKHGLPDIKILSPRTLQEKLQNTLQSYLKRQNLS